MILDGRSRFGCSLQEFYRRHDIAEAAARAGILIPPATDIATGAPPAFAFVNSLAPMEPVARWICRCPDCPGGAAYVWIEAPIMFCLYCGNRSIGGAFRPVAIPPERETIERLLMKRPDVAAWHWEPYESIEAIRAGNEMMGVA
jgi:hypothetical protein